MFSFTSSASATSGAESCSSSTIDGSDYFPVGPVQSAPGVVPLPETVEFVRVRTTAFTSGEPKAVLAGVVGLHYRNVMDGQTKSFRNSWVVSKRTRLPTGYGPQDFHPELLASENGVIETPRELKRWLAGHE